jgi:hypothetical protein
MKKLIIILLSLSLYTVLNSSEYFFKLKSDNNVAINIIYINGWSSTGLNEGTGTIYDVNGWDLSGINEGTGTIYNAEGYNVDGYDSSGLGVIYNLSYQSTPYVQYSRNLYNLHVGFEYNSGGSPNSSGSVAFYGGRILIDRTHPSLSEKFLSENFPTYISFYNLTGGQTRSYTDANGQRYIVRTNGVARTFAYAIQNQYNDEGVLISYNVYKNQGSFSIQKSL